MEIEKIIQETITYVKQTLKSAEAGHDWSHVLRVYRIALHINAEEKANKLIVSLAALLHDIADSKFFGGDETIGPSRARSFLITTGVSEEIIEQVVLIIRHMSFKNSFEKSVFDSPELRIVQDADRLDAMGAIGIARTFSYGGFKCRPMYDPDIKPNLQHTKESYKNSTSPTINHFYEKLLLLKNSMNTNTGKALAVERHQFMLDYLEQFFAEWRGER